jgi:two-component system sensor histidine kinase KdpD
MQSRSDPDVLLQQIQQEELREKRGKLKIYLGSAPGVGKTYKMLHDAYDKRLKHLDVVIGIIESHGREDIQAMLQSFEAIPTQALIYRKKSYAEFDLDAALKRAPGIVLVDEMAHTNIPGLRHEKRWQDIKELLDCGIDVYTTLNIQHIESLKDDVAQIIQAPVSETVPDFMLERAHTIELVDLPVEEHLKRLKEGKIYIHEQANIAALNFFREGNLIALRELALRVTASFIQSDMMSYRKTEGIQQIWPIRDKILICVGPHQQSMRLIRTAKRMASSLQAEWLAVYIDTPNIAFSKEKRDRAIQNLRLAEQLGATTYVLTGKDVVREILHFARESNVTQIMLLKDRSRGWRHLFRRRLADEMIKHCGAINVYIVAEQPTRERARPSMQIPLKKTWYYYLLGVVFVGLATGFNLLVQPITSIGMQAIVYVLVVMVVAMFGYLGPSLLASWLSIVTFDYFCMPPVYAFKVDNPNAILTLILFFIVAAFTNYLILINYRETKMARTIQQQTRILYLLSRQLLKARGLNEILTVSISYIAELFHVEVIALLPNQIGLHSAYSYPEDVHLGDKDLSIAHWVYDMAQPAGLGTDTLTSNPGLFLPLSTVSKYVLGVLKITPQTPNLFSPDQMRLLESCVNQLTLALEIERLQERSRKKQLKSEVDSAKNALLKTISIQLNYPLKLILEGIGTSLQSKGEVMQVNVSERLDKISLINNNILQVIEFETAKIKLNKQTVNFIELLQNALKLLQTTRHKREIYTHYVAELPTIRLDADRIQEVLLNLLDNAIKYSTPNSNIDIYIEAQPLHIWVSIENEGTPLEKEELIRIFNPFYRSMTPNHEDSLGLGLTLCQLNIEAHQGMIWAENVHEKGVIAFRFVIPY